MAMAKGLVFVVTVGGSKQLIFFAELFRGVLRVSSFFCFVCFFETTWAFLEFLRGSKFLFSFARVLALEFSMFFF